MSERNKKFFCCTQKKISISACPTCNQMFGYCHSCSTLFHNLQDVSTTSVIPREGEVTCSGCQFYFFVTDIPKHLVTRSEVAEAGLSFLLSEEVEVREDNSDPDLINTLSGDDTPEIRCPKCGNKMPVNSLECPKCGLPTPLGRSGGAKSVGKPSSGQVMKEQARAESQQKGSGHLQTKSGRLKQSGPLKKGAAKSLLLPGFLANSPLAKIYVPPALAVALTIAIPLAAFVYYMATSTQTCFNCANVAGKYSTEFSVEGTKVKVDLLLYQYKSGLTGQVIFTPEDDSAQQPNAKTAPKQYTEIIQSGKVNEANLTFQSYKRDDNGARVQFSGQMTEGVLNGNLEVTMPEFDCIRKSFQISARKS